MKKTFTTIEKGLLVTDYALADDYGLSQGELSFDLKLDEGCIKIGTRLFETRMRDIGLWFELDADKLSLKERHTPLSLEFKHEFKLDKVRVRISEDRGRLSFYLNENKLVSVYSNRGKLSIFDNNDSLVSEYDSEFVPYAGYCQIDLRQGQGEIKNLEYDYEKIDKKPVNFGEYEIDYSTWVACDDLKRISPDNSIAKDKREGKYVGIFYFMCHVYKMGEYVRDHTKIYLERGLEGFKAFLKTSHGGHWAEPYLGYYLSTDEWIYRKHAYMFSNAGIDFIFLDFSNHQTFPHAHKILFDTWLQIRREGGKTPQIVPMCGDMPSIMVVDLYTIWDTIFSVPEYEELLFKWEGKPLILGNNDNPEEGIWTVSGTTPQTREDFYRIISRDEKILEFFQSGRYHELLDKLTVRKCWAWQASKYDGYWDWLDWSPQALGTNFEGKAEQISVKMGTHAHTSTGRSFLGKKDYGNGLEDFEFSMDTARYGLCFDQQFKHAIEMDPDVIMITGWNEWYAGCIKRPDIDNLVVGHTKTDGYYLVDQFNPEFSRDGEPMKLRDGLGFGDNFYYQMVNFIREYKGIDRTPIASGQGTIDIEKGIEGFKGVLPRYEDNKNETMYRRHQSWGGGYLYINSTGRNDLDYAKVSQDEDYIYFLITTAEPIIFADDENWMNLFININQDYNSGWEGYDYIINRRRDSKGLSVEKFIDNSWKFEEVSRADYFIGENYLTLKLDKKILGLGKAMVSFDFKWADNSTSSGNIMEFMDLGDCAPDDRFNFRYLVK